MELSSTAQIASLNRRNTSAAFASNLRCPAPLSESSCAVPAGSLATMSVAMLTPSERKFWQSRSAVCHFAALVYRPRSQPFAPRVSTPPATRRSRRPSAVSAKRTVLMSSPPYGTLFFAPLLSDAPCSSSFVISSRTLVLQSGAQPSARRSASSASCLRAVCCSATPSRYHAFALEASSAVAAEASAAAASKSLWASAASARLHRILARSDGGARSSALAPSSAARARVYIWMASSFRPRRKASLPSSRMRSRASAPVSRRSPALLCCCCAPPT
mmetsp:Transcript_39274/g.131166  ORF Transcript_39274/g.131166 Transcript_39274/m.131166 type:complete len:274 (-) Transcript_39274:889-1710(-)